MILSWGKALEMEDLTPVLDSEHFPLLYFVKEDLFVLYIPRYGASKYASF